jgi:hypothetical protein
MAHGRSFGPEADSKVVSARRALWQSRKAFMSRAPNRLSVVLRVKGNWSGRRVSNPRHSAWKA